MICVARQRGAAGLLEEKHKCDDVRTNDVANTFSNIVTSIFFSNFVFNNINVAGFHGV